MPERHIWFDSRGFPVRLIDPRLRALAAMYHRLAHVEDQFLSGALLLALS